MHTSTPETIFDPRVLDESNINWDGQLLPPRIRSLSERYRGAMLCGLTLSVPHSSYLLPAEMIRRQIVILGKRVIQQNDEEALVLLNTIIRKNSRRLHQGLCRIFNEGFPDECGTVHGNTGSELFAEVNARLRWTESADPTEGHFLGKVMTFARGGRVVNKALAGGDIRENIGINYDPSVNLLTPARREREISSIPELEDLIFIHTDRGPVGFANDAYVVTNGTLPGTLSKKNGKGDWDKDLIEPQVSVQELFDIVPDSTILQQVKSALNSHPDLTLAVIPAVDAMGRIWPWQKIADIIDQENLRRGVKGLPTIFKLLNAVQAIGRENIRHPLDYYDAVVTVGYKALAGAMVSSALLARRETLESFYPPDKNLPWYIEEYHAVHRVPEYCYQTGNVAGTISVPELHSFWQALDDFYQRGSGNTFAQRRTHMFKEMEMLRARFIAQLDSRFDVLDKSEGVRLTPSCICFGLNEGFGPDQQLTLSQRIKHIAQQTKTPAVTLSGNIGPVMRVSIPEHHFQKSGGRAYQDPLLRQIDYAVDSLNTILGNIL